MLFGRVKKAKTGGLASSKAVVGIVPPNISPLGKKLIIAFAVLLAIGGAGLAIKLYNSPNKSEELEVTREDGSRYIVRDYTTRNAGSQKTEEENKKARDEAIAELNKKHDTLSYTEYRDLAQLYYANGNYEKAIENYELAKKTAPTAIENYDEFIKTMDTIIAALKEIQ